MRFLALDSWRGVAALFITLYYLPALYHFNGSEFIHGAFLGVDFFFVLSGFVITHSYFHRIDKLSSITHFMTRRIARLLPLHVFMLILLIGYEVMLLVATKVGIDSPRAIFDHRTSFESIFTNLFLLQSLGIHDTTTWNLPSWSISTEFYTYLVFAIMAVTLRKYWYVACVVIVGCSAALLIFISKDNGNYINWGHDWGFYRCLMGFFSGSIIYGIYMKLSQNGQKRLAYANLFEVLALSLMGYLIAVKAHSPVNMLAPVIFGFAIFVFAFEGGFISNLLKASPFKALGRWSYSIYLTHFFIVQIIMSVVIVFEKIFKVSLKSEIIIMGDPKFMIDFGNVFYNDLLALAYLAITLGFSAFTYKFVELKGQAWINNLTGIKPKEKANTEAQVMPAE